MPGTETTTGDGWAVGSIEAMGDGPGFRKVRREGGYVGRDGMLPEGETSPR